MKKILSVLVLLSFLSLPLNACGGEDTAGEKWRDERDSGYSQDYQLTPGRKFCARFSQDGGCIEIFDSDSGNRCGTLDFRDRSDAALFPSLTLDLLEFSDHDGDGYSDFGIPMADGSMVWYKYRFGSDPAKQTDCFSFLEVQPDAVELPADPSDVASDRASDGA